MKYEIQIDDTYAEPKVVIFTASITEDVNEVVKKLSDATQTVISGFKDEKVEILEPSDLIRIYANAGKVIAVTSRGEYILKLRLYEMENLLNRNDFVRISNSEIVNLKKVKNFDLSLTGTILIKLSDGTTSYVSRRYVAAIKKILGV